MRSATPRFRRLLAGNSVSSFGDSALYLSLGIWAKDLTGSNPPPGPCSWPWGSATSPPRWRPLRRPFARRHLLMVTNAATAVVVLSLLVVRSRDQLWVIYAVALAYGAARA